MRRYEYVEGTSAKFWEITLEKTRYTTRYGRIGTDGRTTTKECGDAEAARKKFSSLCRGKEKKGYKYVEPSPPKRKRPIKTAEATIAPEHKELEAAIFDDRDDAQAWLVLGDWLKSHGDPRGEAITLSFNDESRKLKRLIAKHEESWLGELYAPYREESEHAKRHKYPSPLAFEWRHGVMHHARVAYYDEAPCAETLKRLFQLPASRFLHSLTIGGYVSETPNNYDGLPAILKKATLPGLRHLYVGDFTYEHSELSWSRVDDIHKYLKAFPKLVSLRVRSGDLSATSLNHSELRSLTLESGGIGPKMTKLIGKARLPKLETLEFWTGQEHWGGYGPLSDYAPLLSGKTCPKLTHLGFRNSDQADEFVNVIAKSALLPQLETLDLSMGRFTPRGARDLIAHKDQFKHLATINVSNCCLGADVVKDLNKHFGARLVAGKQRTNLTYASWDSAVEDAEREGYELEQHLWELECYTAVGE